MWKLRFWAKLIVSLMGCVILIWWVDWKQSIEILTKADGTQLLLVFMIIHMDRVFMAYKWSILLRGLEVTVSRKEILQAYYIGFFWGTFLPSSGGDVVRASWLINKGHSGAPIISSVVMERLGGALALAMVAAGSVLLLTLYVEWSFLGLYVVVGLLFAEAGILLMALFSRRGNALIRRVISYLPFKPIRTLLNKIELGALTFREKPHVLVIFLILCLVEQLFPILGTYLLARALAIDLHLIWSVIGVPILMAVSRLPISINAWGVQEGAFAFIFSIAGLPLAGAVMVSLANRILLALSALPGALWTMAPAKGNAAPRMVTNR
jgi:uncharacterized protein (TIRG00374 family)